MWVQEPKLWSHLLLSQEHYQETQLEVEWPSLELVSINAIGITSRGLTYATTLVSDFKVFSLDRYKSVLVMSCSSTLNTYPVDFNSIHFLHPKPFPGLRQACHQVSSHNSRDTLSISSLLLPINHPQYP